MSVDPARSRQKLAFLCQTTLHCVQRIDGRRWVMWWSKGSSRRSEKATLNRTGAARDVIRAAHQVLRCFSNWLNGFHAGEETNHHLVPALLSPANFSGRVRVVQIAV